MKKTNKGWELQDDGSYISGSTGDIMTPHKYKNRKHNFHHLEAPTLY